MILLGVKWRFHLLLYDDPSLRNMLNMFNMNISMSTHATVSIQPETRSPKTETHFPLERLRPSSTNLPENGGFVPGFDLG